MPYLQEILVEIANGIGESQENLYDSPIVCYAQVSGIKSVSRSTATGFTREDRFRFIFPAGYLPTHIINGAGESVELPIGSRIQYNGRYYLADSAEPNINQFNRFTEIRCDCVPGGKVAATETPEPELVLDGQGVDHSILPSPQSAIRGEFAGVGGI